MKEKREALEKLNADIFALTAKCAEIIPQNTEDWKVVNQSLTKLSTVVNNMHLETFKEEEL